MKDKRDREAVELSGEQLELLEQLLAEEGIQRSEVKRIEPRGKAREIPLSFAQQRLWFLDQLDPNRAAYNISAAYQLSGPLNVAALQQTINEIIRRHEVFRTTFRSQDGQPFQVVAPEQMVELRITDLSQMPKQEKEAEVHRLAVEN